MSPNIEINIMKKDIPDWLKNMGYVAGYWILFVVTPMWLMFYLNYKSLGHINIFTPMIWYVIFIVPILFTIPYKLARPKLPRVFISLGMIVPYVFMFILFYLLFIKNFGPLIIL